MKKLSIILPGYNEGETVSDLLDDYQKALSGHDGMEVVFVNNGSTDDTPKYLADWHKKNRDFPLKIVTIKDNRGYGHGIVTGLKEAEGEFLAWSHADLQCPGADTVKLFDAVTQSSDPKRCFGKGMRTNERGMMGIFPALHTFFSDVVLGFHLEEINAQPKLFHRSFLGIFKAPPIGYELDIYAYYKAVFRGYKIVTVEVVFLDRQAGQSKWAYSAYSFARFLVKNFLYLLKLRLFRNRI